MLIARLKSMILISIFSIISLIKYSTFMNTFYWLNTRLNSVNYDCTFGANTGCCCIICDDIYGLIQRKNHISDAFRRKTNDPVLVAGRWVACMRGATGLPFRHWSTWDSSCKYFLHLWPVNKPFLFNPNVGLSYKAM